MATHVTAARRRTASTSTATSSPRLVAQRYARLAGVPYRSLAWPPGSASRWQNGLGQTSFVVELPAGELPDAAAKTHAAAVLRLAE